MPDQTGRYIVTHTNGSGCESVDTISIYIGTSAGRRTPGKTGGLPPAVLNGMRLRITGGKAVTVMLCDLKGAVISNAGYEPVTVVSLGEIAARGGYVLTVSAAGV